MGAPWGKSSRRSATCEQSEYCDLCGALVDASTLIESEVQGLSGMMICKTHPWEEIARSAPSFQDMGGIGQAPAPVLEDWPHGGPDYTPARVRYLTLQTTTGTLGLENVAGLTFDVLVGESYSITFNGRLSWITPSNYLVAFGDTCLGVLAANITVTANDGSVTTGTLSALNGQAAVALGPPNGTAVAVITGTIRVTQAGTFTYMMRRNGTLILYPGAYLQIVRQ